jgi:signal transduction histidine kinase
MSWRWHLTLVSFLSAVTASPWARPIPAPLPTLTSADQIRHLSPEEAARGYPVRIRGVIICDIPAPDFFIQDSTAGIYVEGDTTRRFSHVLGQEVELVGVTGPGKFAPVIRERALNILGEGTLPKPRLYSFAELADGGRDSQWTQIRGIVRSASIDRESWHETALALRVASGGGEFNVRVPVSGEVDVSSWVDSEVLIEGVCGTIFNSQRQLVGILFYVPRLSFIKIEAPAPEVPFSALLRFAPGDAGRHRVRVRGVVGYQQPGVGLFLQNGDRGLRVMTQQETPLRPGDVVDVIGFPVMGESAPMLEDAVFRRVGQQGTPQPLVLDGANAWEQYDGVLVSTVGKLLSRQMRGGEIQLLLQRGDLVLEGTLQSGSAPGRILIVPVNSEVRVTGICLVRSGGLWLSPQSFRILLRSADDLAVVRTPSWFNLGRTLWLLGITAVVLLCVMVWVFVLGRRLRVQRAVHREKLRSSAVLEERNRIARELHDTLEQELAGITMQLDLANDCFQGAPRIAQEALETARSMSRRSMVEARRSVWDLRCHLLERGDLVSALRQIVEPLAPEGKTRVKVEVAVEGEVVRLAGPIEMNLLRIGQEAVCNAIKHGGAGEVVIELCYAPAAVRLSIRDNGSGFAAEQPAATGHFGLLDMRERAQSLGSVLQVVSEPGLGTEITVEVGIKPSQVVHEEQLEANPDSRGR